MPTASCARSAAAGYRPFPSRLVTSGQRVVNEYGYLMAPLKGFNMQVDSGFTWPASVFTDIAALGGKINRTVLFWNTLEPTQGAISATYIASLDLHIARAEAAGLYSQFDLHLNVGRDPTWAGGTTGTATSTTATSLTDSGAAWTVNAWSGLAITAGSSTATVSSNTATVITVPSWTGGTPAGTTTYTVGVPYEMERYKTYGQTVTQYLANRYGNPTSPNYTKSVIGFGLNEPPLDDGTIRNGNGSIPYLEGIQSSQMITWMRATNYAPSWIGFVGYGYGSATPIYDPTWQNASTNASPTAYAGVGGNVIIDFHDYMEGITGTTSTSPTAQGRLANGMQYPDYQGGPLVLTNSTSNPTYTSTATSKSQLNNFLVPYKAFSTSAQIPLMIGEWGWVSTSTGELPYIADQGAGWGVSTASANLLTAGDADFEGGTVGNWNAYTGTIATSTAKAYSGTHSLAITAAAAGINVGTTTTGVYSASPGTVYTASGWILAAATPLTVQFSLAWYTSGGVYISNNISTVSSVTAGWTQATVTALPPSTAAWATVGWFVGAATLGQIYYVDNHSLITNNWSGAAIEMYWDYDTNATNEPYAARPGGVWRSSVLAWLAQ